MYHRFDTLGVNNEAVPHLSSCLAILLAGGKGTRLYELTDQECKPALSFGNDACLADFSISDAFNSGFGHIMVATQYCPWHLHQHLALSWRSFLEKRGGMMDVRHGPSVTRSAVGYDGTAGAITANIARIDDLAPVMC